MSATVRIRVVLTGDGSRARQCRAGVSPPQGERATARATRGRYLHVDVEEARLASGADRLNGGDRRAVDIRVHVRILDELAAGDHRLHGHLVAEMVVHAVLCRTHAQRA
eukprot:5118960-Prymnesium_polylepis.1